MTQSLRGTDAPTPMTCPRCGADVVQDFYGPCAACHADLRERFASRPSGEDVVVEAAERVHRTPNFVATKD